jgi:hypothetical protein
MRQNFVVCRHVSFDKLGWAADEKKVVEHWCIWCHNIYIMYPMMFPGEYMCIGFTYLYIFVSQGKNVNSIPSYFHVWTMKHTHALMYSPNICTTEFYVLLYTSIYPRTNMYMGWKCQHVYTWMFTGEYIYIAYLIYRCLYPEAYMHIGCTNL